MLQLACTQFSLQYVQRLKQNKENNKGSGVWGGSVQLDLSKGVFVSYFGILTFALCLDLHPPGIMHECQDLWMSSTTVTIFIKLDSILIFWGLLDAQKAPNPMNSVLLGIHDLNNNLGSAMVIHSCVAKSQNPPKIHHRAMCGPSNGPTTCIICQASLKRLCQLIEHIVKRVFGVFRCQIGF